jgi:hypothetical protein
MTDFGEPAESLTDAVAFTDPIDTVFDINEQMLRRVSRIRYVLTYAFWAGVVALLLATIAILWVLLTGPDPSALALLGFIIVLSIVAVWFAHQERPFLDEYQILAGAVHRAKDWLPRSRVPQGDSPLNRFLAYLEAHDDRFEYFYKKKPEYLQRDVLLKGKSKKQHHFDAFFQPSSFPWDKIEESVRVFIRVVDEVDSSTIEDMKEAVEDVLSAIGRPQWVFKPCGTRVVLIQTQSDEFDDDVIEEANERRIRYTRDIGGTPTDWSLPAELVAEDGDFYNFGTTYFG